MVLEIALGSKSIKDFSASCGIDPQLFYKFLREEFVPEKYRKQIADQSAKIEPTWFNPVYRVRK